MRDSRVQLAVDALDRGNGERALEHLSGVPDLDDPDVWHIRTAALTSTGAFQAAEDAARRGLAVDPDHVGLRLSLADCLDDLGRESEAERVLIGLLNQRPDNHVVLTRYAWLLAHAGDAEGARAVLTRLPPARLADTASVLALQGYVAMIEGRRREAKMFLDQGMAIDPEASSTRMLLSLEASLGDRPVTSADHMLAAAALDPEGAGELGRLARYMKHPLMAPTRLVTRFGQTRLWIAWIAVLLGLPRVWPGAPMGWIILAYLAFVVYSWTVPFLLSKWMIWRGQL